MNETTINMLQAAEHIRQVNETEDNKHPIEKIISDPEAPFKDRLRILCGYIENGSETTVKIFQDDATKEWIVKVGKNYYHDSSFDGAFELAFKDPTNNPF